MNLENYKHIIWDWNGTILNDVDLCVEIINSLLTSRNLPAIDKVRYKEIFTIPVKNYYAKLNFDFIREPFELLGKIWMEQYELRKYECSLYDGVVDLLEKIKLRGIGQSILSAYSQSTLENLVEHFGLTEYFSYVVGLDNIYAASKLHLGRDLMGKLGNGKGETLVIGDTLHDFEVAKEIGADCILVSYGHQDRKRLSSVGVKVIDSLAELL
ncbi:HAD family hydrolase [Melioribacteraceae bacterium 4301-Me]|uniref:HAD family hydrolase n=1 Tax=Pyranulibacter aquaticus TaxID=3163344 RepID=UPI003596D7C3